VDERWSALVNGAYVALEGVEGSGKTTVSRAICTELEGRGIECVPVREPGGTWLGEEIRRLLLHEADMTPWAEAALFAAQRAQLAVEVIAPARARGAWVVADRSLYSSLAYQGAARGLGVDAVREVNVAVLNGVLPDLVAVIDLDPVVGLSRQTDADRIGSAGASFQRAVRAAYHSLAVAEPDRVKLVGGALPPHAIALTVIGLAEGARV
jgi:dTMP kinase